jgi:hypothetical protein
VEVAVTTRVCRGLDRRNKARDISRTAHNAPTVPA